MSETVIRPARPADAGAIAWLCETALGYHDEPDLISERMAVMLDKPDHLVLVAEQEGAVLGFAHACNYDQLYAPHMKNLMAIAVTSEARGRGIGKLLLAEVEDWARESEASAIRVVSGEARLDAHHMYRSSGYGGEKGKRSFYKIL